MVLFRFWKIVVPWGIGFLLGRRHSAEISQISFFCTPFDIDLNIHLTNSMYLRLMDFGRWKYAFETGGANEIADRKLVPVVGHVDIRFRKPVPLWGRFVLDTRIVEVEPRKVIFEQTFFRKKDGALYAKARVSASFLRKGKVVEVGKLPEMSGWATKSWRYSE